MQVSYFETGRYYASSNLPREWPMPPGAYDREAGLRAFHGMVERSRRVEGLGFDWVSVSEHHYSPRILTPSGAKRREQGLAKAGNARVRRGMIQLAWRFLRFQQNSALARWYQARTADHRAATRKTMIVALARKLLIALWRFVTTGETLEGVVLRPAG